MQSLDTLQIDNISKFFSKKRILDNVSIYLNKSEVVGLLGPNGAGKTTCFNIIAGLLKPNKGRILLNKQNISKVPMYLRGKLGIGYLPQESSVFRELSVEDNIRAILEIVEDDNDVIEQRIEELLSEFSITHLKYTMAIKLSGGERRRVEIARTLAANPKFIMLDEPLAGIDPISIADLKNLIIHLKDRNIGILITDHNVREVLSIVDRAYIIYDGKVLISGNADTIINDSKAREVYLGDNF